jgi:hypothetical protein
MSGTSRSVSACSAASGSTLAFIRSAISVTSLARAADCSARDSDVTSTAVMTTPVCGGPEPRGATT